MNDKNTAKYKHPLLRKVTSDKQKDTKIKRNCSTEKKTSEAKNINEQATKHSNFLPSTFIGTRQNTIWRLRSL